MSEAYILKFSCRDHPGISMKVTSFIYEHSGNVTESQQFNDPATDTFFMRVLFTVSDAGNDLAKLRSAFEPLAGELSMDWKIREQSEKIKTLLLVSKFDHCLGDLLYRWRIGELPMEPVGIISNHPQDALNLTTMSGLPYYHLPITKETKRQQEAQIKDIINETGAELIVLARYMQILTDDMCGFLSGRCINIHHSFLPGFKGARPYHQAYKRGVKMIGATAHFVTQDLDEGPIISQDVEAISHAETPDDLVQRGRDVERRVLARAVSYYLQDRVFLNGSKTVVFKG